MNKIFRTSQGFMLHSWRLTYTGHYSRTNNNKVISIVSNTSSFQTKQHQMQGRQSVHNVQFYIRSGFQQPPSNNGRLSQSLVPFKQAFPEHETVNMHCDTQSILEASKVTKLLSTRTWSSFILLHFVPVLVQSWEESYKLAFFLYMWWVDS